MHGRRSANAFEIPPGPRNPVGVLWCGLDKIGIGIHGTNTPRDHRPRRQPRLHPPGQLGRHPILHHGHHRQPRDD